MSESGAGDGGESKSRRMFHVKHRSEETREAEEAARERQARAGREGARGGRAGREGGGQGGQPREEVGSGRGGAGGARAGGARAGGAGARMFHVKHSQQGGPQSKGGRAKGQAQAKRGAERKARHVANGAGETRGGVGGAGAGFGTGPPGRSGHRDGAERGGSAFPRVFHVKHSHTRARTRLERQLEAETPDRLDVGVGARGAQLVAEVGHVHVDRAVLGGIRLAPHQLEQLLLGEHALRM